jgi:hypothetical protein
MGFDRFSQLNPVSQLFPCFLCLCPVTALAADEKDVACGVKEEMSMFVHLQFHFPSKINTSPRKAKLESSGFVLLGEQVCGDMGLGRVPSKATITKACSSGSLEVYQVPKLHRDHRMILPPVVWF